MPKKTFFALGEILLRMETEKTRNDLLKNFNLYFGGAEFNVLVGLSGLENKTSMISTVPNNFIGEQIKMYSKKLNVNDDFLIKQNGNQGIYFVERGLGCRPSVISYNRKNSVFVEKIDKLESINFGKKDDWIHISGITISLSEDTFKTSMKILNKCKEKGMKISFDFNFRPKLTDYKTAIQRYNEVLKISDVIFANRKDFTLIFNWDDKMPDQEMFIKVFKEYNVQYIANSTRKIVNDVNYYKGNLYSKNEMVSSNFEKNEIIDRIGGGDAFAAGILNGILNENSNLQEVVENATYQSIIAHSIKGDCAYISKKEVNEYIKNKNSDIQR